MGLNDPTYLSRARNDLARLVLSFDELASRASSLHANDQEASGRIADLQRRLNETEQRAVEAERLCAQLKEKADRGERLDEAVTKLVGAIDRLPLSLDSANLIPSASKPKIQLYGTYEWQAVVDAKFHVQQELKERRKL